jgi:hypothetical protein
MLGLLTSSSSFCVPQVNLPGSMATFVLPNSCRNCGTFRSRLPGAVPVDLGKTGGLGQGDLFPQGISLPMHFDFTGGFLTTYWPYLAGGVVLLILLSRRR